MPNINDMPVTEDAIHLLAIADTKMGKSVYTTQAAIDGFGVAYFDCDNGLSAVRWALRNSPPEVVERLEYYPVRNPADFFVSLFRSKPKARFNWVPRLGRGWGKLLLDIRPDDVVWSFDITKFPKSWVLGIDSWTATASDALGIGDADGDSLPKLLEGTDQSIYASANANLTYIVNMIQKAPFHVVLQAHGTFYERYKKPDGATGIIKQSQMVLQETIEVPVSSSRPHGKEMSSRFNHIGWMSIDGMGDTTIDFTRKLGRIGGGPPNIIEKTKNLPFSKLMSRIPEYVQADDWFIQRTHEEMLALAPTSTIPLPKPAIALAPASSVLEIKPTTPSVPASKFDVAAMKIGMK